MSRMFTFSLLSMLALGSVTLAPGTASPVRNTTVSHLDDRVFSTAVTEAGTSLPEFSQSDAPVSAYSSRADVASQANSLSASSTQVPRHADGTDVTIPAVSQSEISSQALRNVGSDSVSPATPSQPEISVQDLKRLRYHVNQAKMAAAATYDLFCQVSSFGENRDLCPQITQSDWPSFNADGSSDIRAQLTQMFEVSFKYLYLASKFRDDLVSQGDYSYVPTPEQSLTSRLSVLCTANLETITSYLHTRMLPDLTRPTGLPSLFAWSDSYQRNAFNVCLLPRIASEMGKMAAGLDSILAAKASVENAIGATCTPGDTAHCPLNADCTAGDSDSKTCTCSGNFAKDGVHCKAAPGASCDGTTNPCKTGYTCDTTCKASVGSGSCSTSAPVVECVTGSICEGSNCKNAIEAACKGTGTAAKCPDNAECVSGKCTCNTNYSESGGKCQSRSAGAGLAVSTLLILLALITTRL